MVEAHTIDMVLSNLPILSDSQTGLQSHLLNEQEVILVGRKQRRRFHFPESLHEMPMVLPSLESNIRAPFDLLLDQHGVRPVILAEVNDMAMLRLLAREADAVSLVPRVVVRDELKEGLLVELDRIEQIRESFYAITPKRHFPNRIVLELIKGMTSKQSGSKQRAFKPSKVRKDRAWP